MSLEKVSKLTFMTVTERAEILAILALAENGSRPVGKDLSASWLLSDIHDLTWKIRLPNKTRVQDGKFIGFRAIDWNVSLQNGSRLGDAEHNEFLKFLQKAAFFAREHPVNRTSPNTNTHIEFIVFLINLAKSIYLYDQELKPDQNALSRVDQWFIETYIRRYSEGGIFNVLGGPELLIKALYTNALNTNPTNEVLIDPYSMSSEDRAAIKNWLQSSGFITRVTRFRLPYLNMLSICRLIGFDSTINPHAKLRALFKFLIEDTHPLIFTEKLSTEYFSHTSQRYEDAKNLNVSEDSILNVIKHFGILFSLKKHFPSELPNLSILKTQELSKLAKTVGSKPQHTPWIPLKVALKYTTESLRWVHAYGDELVTYYLKVYEHFYSQNLITEEVITDRGQVIWQSKHRDDFVNSNMPKSLRSLNIWGMGNALARGGPTEYGDFEEFRDTPGLSNAIEVLIGSIVVLVGITKPVRQDEVANLHTDCIRNINDRGYALMQHQGKRNTGDNWEEVLKPIPTITAKGLLLIKKLSDGIKRIHEISDPLLLRKLFLFPSFSQSVFKVDVIGSKSINKYLDCFCDYVAIPPDEYNRRWYVRIHELRKSFLITFFWCFKFASLDAAKWMAGHGSAEHIYAYIQANFPGDELPALEAEYATQLMWDFESSLSTSDVGNIEELYHLVCNHFGVTSINLIESEILKEWVTQQFESGHYQIVPFSIKSRDGTVATDIAFKVKDRE